MAVTQLRNDTFEKLVINSGIVLWAVNVDDFTFENTDIIGATDGGITLNIAREYVDFAEGIDGATTNMKEFKRCIGTTVDASATLKTMSDNKLIEFLLSHATVTEDTTKGISKFTLKNDVAQSDFKDLYVMTEVGDDEIMLYHLKNCLNTTFSVQTQNKEKGNITLSATAHNTIEAQDAVPVDIYVKRTVTPPAQG